MPVGDRTAPWWAENATGGGSQMAEQNQITVTQWTHIWWNLGVKLCKATFQGYKGSV